MKLTLNISPCPNDTFMFDALINGRIDTRGYTFDVDFFDIEELNDRVMRLSPDISKISYAVLPEIIRDYILLDSGSALGHGNGPVLVCGQKHLSAAFVSEEPSARIAIPGTHTTANLLLEKLFPHLTDRHPVLFSDIAPAIARGEFDAGVLIHEGRFTYRDHGLEFVADLGVEWARATGNLPLPLGAIVASRRLSPETVKTVEELIRESIEYALARPDASREFIKSHAREMDDDVIESHIALFVNANSLSLDPSARRAVATLTGVEV